MPSPTSIYRVSFFTTPDESGELEFYFTSLAAIYELFSEDQVGAPLWRLWKEKISDGLSFETDRCEIFKYPLHAKKQKAKKS